MKRGRPPKPAAERRGFVVCARLTATEYRKLRAGAKRAGLSVSAYAQKTLSEAKP